MLGSFLAALVGGLFIGVSAAALLATYGRIAGISGILGGVLGGAEDRQWRILFLAGLAAGGLAIGLLWRSAVGSPGVHSSLALVAAGLLVGFGTRLGNGCTSGHGVCGVGRLSKRSIVATITFMLAGGLTTFVVRHALGSEP